MLIVLFYIIGLSTILINIFGPRTFDVLQSFDMFNRPLIIENQSIAIITIITKVLFLIICIIVIFFGLIRRKFQLPKQGLTLTIAGLLLFFPVIITSLLSQHDGFSYRLFYFPLFVIAAYISPRIRPSKHIKMIISVLLIIIYFSLLSILIDPSWAFSDYSQSWIGIPIRLFGTSSHPNGLGYVALAYVILVRMVNKHDFWSCLSLCAAIIVIILTQSKTVWVALVAWLAMEWVIINFSANKQRIFRTFAFLLVLILVFATYLLVFQKDFFIGLNLTLTGRIYVWQISFETWLENPILGYGPNFWDIYFRQDYGYLWAGQAHNQFLQTLGESGILGFGTLLLFFIIIIRVGSRSAINTNFASYGIIVALVIRSFFESPLSTYSLDQSFLVLAIFWVILLNSHQTIDEKMTKKKPIWTQDIMND